MACCSLGDVLLRTEQIWVGTTDHATQVWRLSLGVEQTVLTNLLFTIPSLSWSQSLLLTSILIYKARCVCPPPSQISYFCFVKCFSQVFLNYLWRQLPFLIISEKLVFQFFFDFASLFEGKRPHDVVVEADLYSLNLFWLINLASIIGSNCGDYYQTISDVTHWEWSEIRWLQSDRLLQVVQSCKLNRVLAGCNQRPITPKREGFKNNGIFY